MPSITVRASKIVDSVLIMQYLGFCLYWCYYLKCLGMGEISLNFRLLFEMESSFSTERKFLNVSTVRTYHYDKFPRLVIIL